MAHLCGAQTCAEPLRGGRECVRVGGRPQGVTARGCGLCRRWTRTGLNSQAASGKSSTREKGITGVTVSTVSEAAGGAALLQRAVL